MSAKPTRRSFLKLIGLSALSLPALSTLPVQSLRTPPVKSSSPRAKAILFDGSRCIGCRLCMAACKLRNNLPAEKKYEPGPYKLSAKTWITVLPYVSSEPTFARYSCMHCNEPACASVCPAKAITKYEEGPVVIDTNRCFGCKYCIVACPFRIPKFDEEKRTAVKCHMCYDRVLAGLRPACVDACPVGALSFGDKDLVVKKATSIAKERGVYLYGLEEAAGTSVVLMLEVPPHKFKLPEVDKASYSSPAVLSKVLTVRGGIGLFGLAILAFIGFILWRREVIGREKVKEIPR